MSDYQYTDEFGYPLSSTQALMRRRQGVPLQTGATERAGLAPVPATVHQMAEDAEGSASANIEDRRSHHAG